jgi:hypothetical protein
VLRGVPARAFLPSDAKGRSTVEASDFQVEAIELQFIASPVPLIDPAAKGPSRHHDILRHNGRNQPLWEILA